MPDFSFNQLGEAFKSVSSTLLGTNEITGNAPRSSGTVMPASSTGLFGQIEGLLTRGYGVYDTYKGKGRATAPAPQPSQFIQQDKSLIYIAGGGLALVVVVLLLGRGK